MGPAAANEPGKERVHATRRAIGQYPEDQQHHATKRSRRSFKGPAGHFHKIGDMDPFDMGDMEIERTLSQIGEVFVFQIPPRSTASGHRAEDWPKKQAWAGKMRITAKGDLATIQLIDKDTGKLFASCPVKRGDDSAYEKVTDSSRYFALKVVNGAKHAFIGIAFQQRSDAFEFNVTLNDFKTQLEAEKQQDEASASAAAAPARDFSLKQGQTIKVAIKSSRPKKERPAGGGGGGGGGMLAPPPRAGGGLLAPPPRAGGGGGGGLLAPPPRGGAMATAQAAATAKVAAPPAPAAVDPFAAFAAAPAPAAAPAAAAASAADPFAGFGDMGAALPSSGAAQAAPASDPFSASDAGWTTFG